MHKTGEPGVVSSVITIVGIVLSTLIGGMGLRVMLRKDRLDVEAAEAAKLALAEQRGYEKAKTDLQIAELRAQLNHQQQTEQGGQQ